MTETRELLGLEDTLYFACHSSLSCFTTCCRDVNILLSPYDIIRMKNRLGLFSTEFLEEYTKTLIAPKTALPAVQLKMNEQNERRCYFVDTDGCAIYEDRPWSCRMYPIDRSEKGNNFRIVVDSSRCQGLKAQEGWKLADWLREQDLEPYDASNELFAKVTEDQELTTWRINHPQGCNIFHLACYDLDRFREVMFRESLHEMISSPTIDLPTLRTDDLALLEFAFAWLKAVASHSVEADNTEQS